MMESGFQRWFIPAITGGENGKFQGVLCSMVFPMGYRQQLFPYPSPLRTVLKHPAEGLYELIK